MLINNGLSTKFWAEGAQITSIVLNMTPTKAHKKSSMHKEWTGTAPDVSKIKTFGCRVLVKDPSPSGKFAARTWDGIYLEPSQGGDGHRVWDPATSRMNNSRDVYFLEDKGKPHFQNSPTVPVLTPTAMPPTPLQEDKQPSATITVGRKFKGKNRKNTSNAPANRTSDQPLAGSAPPALPASLVAQKTISPH